MGFFTVGASGHSPAPTRVTASAVDPSPARTVAAGDARCALSCGLAGPLLYSSYSTRRLDSVLSVLRGGPAPACLRFYLDVLSQVCSGDRPEFGHSKWPFPRPWSLRAPCVPTAHEALGSLRKVTLACGLRAEVGPAGKSHVGFLGSRGSWPPASRHKPALPRALCGCPPASPSSQASGRSRRTFAPCAHCFCSAR